MEPLKLRLRILLKQPLLLLISIIPKNVINSILNTNLTAPHLALTRLHNVLPQYIRHPQQMRINIDSLRYIPISKQIVEKQLNENRLNLEPHVLVLLHLPSRYVFDRRPQWLKLELGI